MKITHVKYAAIFFFVMPVLLLMLLKAPPAKGAETLNTDPGAEFKAKCAACHAPNASKFYDPAKADSEHIQAVLKGKKGEKPPYMPGFEAKGMTEDGAKALVAHMKALRNAN